VSAAADDAVRRAEARLGISFRRKELLRAALTHGSAKLAEGGLDNERLEFLGDALVGFLVAEHLYLERPGFDEGRMSRVRSQVVSRRSLAALGRRLGLADLVVVGKMFASTDAIAESVLSNACEALLGALYLDQGLDAVRAFVLDRLGDVLAAAEAAPAAREWKSALSAYAQARRVPTPVYVLISTAGADHEKTFEVRAELDGVRFPPGFGRNKQEAESRAARHALFVLGAAEPEGA
jgi:ribonuclease-3